MKISKYFLALAMGGMIVACAPKAETEAAAEGEAEATEVAPQEKTAKDYVASKSEKDDIAYLLGINFGSFLKGYNFGDDLNYNLMIKGMKDFLKAEGDPYDPEFGKQFKVDPAKMNEMINSYLEKKYYHTLYTNKEAGEKYMKANAGRPGVQTTASGLQYKILADGNDVKPAPVDTVWVNYKGTTIDGKVFDETAEGAEPVKFVLNQVVKGWTEGLQFVGEGGEIELVIPAELAYGEGGSGKIEPNSTLIFNIKLSKVGKAVPAEEK